MISKAFYVKTICVIFTKFCTAYFYNFYKIFFLSPENNESKLFYAFLCLESLAKIAKILNGKKTQVKLTKFTKSIALLLISNFWFNDLIV